MNERYGKTADVVWEVKLSDEGLQLLDGDARVYGYYPITRAGSREATAYAFHNGANSVDFKFDLKLIED